MKIRQIISAAWTDPKKVFLLFIVLSLIAFFPTRFAGLTYDFIGWQEAYDKGSWGDIINCFGYKGLHQVLHLVFYSLYRLLHTYAVGWYIVFALAHSGVAFLVYQWFNKMQEVLGIQFFKGASLVAGIFVLLHPHSLEVVVWKVCIHYIMSTLWLLGIMINYLNYLKTPNRRHLIWVYVFYTLSLFTLEISYITPVLMLLTVIVFSAILKSWETFYSGIKKIVVPLFILLGLMLSLNRIVLGTWVGHYGPEVHLNFDFLSIAANEFKYLVKHLTLLRFGSFKLKVAIFDTMGGRIWAYHFLLIILMMIIFWFAKLNRFTKKQHFLFYGIFGFFLLIFPIANMFFSHLMLGHNDRFGYVPILFIAIFMITLISMLPKYLKWGVLIVWLCTNIYLQQKLAHLWQKSNVAFTTLTADFRWYDRDKVVMLNLPDNYNGILVYSTINEPSGFVEALEYNLGKKFQGKMYDGYLYNMMDLNEGAKVEQTGPRTLKIEFNQWGNWWFYDGIGAGSYENDFYKISNHGHHFNLDIKDEALDATFIYQDGLKLHEFKFDPNWQKKD